MPIDDLQQALRTVRVALENTVELSTGFSSVPLTVTFLVAQKAPIAIKDADDGQWIRVFEAKRQGDTFLFTGQPCILQAPEWTPRR